MPSKKSTIAKSIPKKNGASRGRKRTDAPSKKTPARSAKASGNGANGEGTSRKRKLTKKEYEKMTANELTLLAWEATYANRHRRLTD
jgi:hypothetical protein